MPVVTALRERPQARVEVDLDGQRWRTLPADAVIRTGLSVGRPLDRETARALAREVRRAKALGTAVRALRHRDLSRRRLEERLERRGAGAAARTAALETLARAGLVDDARFAASRARALAERGYGDASIRFDLERQGVSREIADEAVGALDPEADRAKALAERRGADARTARWLTARGFDEASVETAVSGFADGA